MQLVERHIINKQHSQYKTIDNACFLSKNLYNTALYIIKQEFIKSGKWIRYNQLDKLLKTSNQVDYRALTNNTSQQILMTLDKNLKSYFQAIKSWKRDNKKFLGCPKFPKYKDKSKGRNLLVYTYVQLGFRDDFIKFPKREGLSPLKTRCKKEDICQVRVIPQSSCYVIEVVYDFQEDIKSSLNDSWLGIDLGLNNLATCVTSKESKSFIINGKPIKSINHFYNKKRAEIQSHLEKNHKKKTSKRLKKLTYKRNNKIADYIHKSSRKIINYCVENSIDNVVIGKNDGWKQEINLGKRNNQNFVQVPFDKFILQLDYKCKLKGINFKVINEAYTSKCSALDLEPICKHDAYAGKRIKRGLFQTSNDVNLNADVNGALNILRKEVGDSFLKKVITNRGCVYHPFKINS